jgi:uncharacterized protein YbjT (DUF2867 family)
MSRIVTLIGASGLIGGHLLDLLLKDPTVHTIRALVRKTVPANDHKLQQFIINFEDPKEYEPHMAGVDAVFCAVGTTNSKVQGDKDLYKKVDYDIPVYAAKAAAKYGVYSFALVSSVGANPDNNRNFYLKLKGVVEEAVCKEEIPSINIMRPSLLLGQRNEKRFGEKIAQSIMPAFSWFLGGSSAKYKAIDAVDVARAMHASANSPVKGIHFYDYTGIMELIGKGKD